MHLLCHDQNCPGNDLPAAPVGEDRCRFCGSALQDGQGQVLAQGAAPLVRGEPPVSFDAWMDALHDAGDDVQLVELTAVRHGDRLLYSTVTPEGAVVAAGVTEGQAAENLTRVMDTLDDSP